MQAVSESVLRSEVAEDARAAGRAARQLADGPVEGALREAGALVHQRRVEILRANAADYDAAATSLDAGTLDRLRLDESRVDALSHGLEATAELPPLERRISERTLANGLRVSEWRIPIGVVGANFEARPNVALDVAGQLLKGLNGGVLRTGGAALRTVSVLVDDVLRPALAAAGLAPEALALVRSSEREGARILVTLPELIPLVILRGSGPSTAELARLAVEHGVRTLAHAEGGGVLYIAADADAEMALAVVRSSLDRLGVCNRLNLALVDRRRTDLVPRLLELFSELQLDVRGSERAGEVADVAPLDVPLGYEWASDPARVSTVTLDVVDGVEQALTIANEHTSGLAAGIVTGQRDVAERFLAGYRGTTAFWNAPTRFADGFELTGAPETGINVDRVPGPRGPVAYRDLYLRQYRIVGDGTQSR